MIPPGEEEMEGQEGTGDSLGEKGTSGGGCGMAWGRM